MACRFFVTGAQGFLGRHLVHALTTGPYPANVLGVGRGHRLRRHFTHQLQWLNQVVQAPIPPELDAGGSAADVSYARVDVRHREALLDALLDFTPDFVVHCAAALHHAPWTELRDANVDGTVALVDSLAALPHPPRLVLVSSGSVYGPRDALPFQEVESTIAATLYGVTKRASEDVARVLCEQNGIDLVRARVFNLIGPGLQHEHVPAVIAAQVAGIALNETEATLRLGRLDATRDFIDVRDAADALVQVAHHAPSNSIVNIATGSEVPIRYLVDRLSALAGLANLTASVERSTPGAELTRAVADVTGLRTLMYQPRRRLDESLAQLLEYYMTVVPAAARSV